jgi:hypothetical protein
MSLIFLSGPTTKTLRTVRLSAGVAGLGVAGGLRGQHRVELGYLEVAVADEGVGGGVALGLLDVAGPAAVVFGRVDRQPDDLDIAAVELGLDLGHVAKLGRADWGEVLGVREQHRPRGADPLVEADAAFGRLGLEVGCCVADLESHLTPLPAVAVSVVVKVARTSTAVARGAKQIVKVSRSPGCVELRFSIAGGLDGDHGTREARRAHRENS